MMDYKDWSRPRDSEGLGGAVLTLVVALVAVAAVLITGAVVLEFFSH